MPEPLLGDSGAAPERGRSPEVLAREITVTLTVEQSQALRMASYFGPPDEPHAPLNEARMFLLDAERAAGHAI